MIHLIAKGAALLILIYSFISWLGHAVPQERVNPEDQSKFFPDAQQHTVVKSNPISYATAFLHFWPILYVLFH